MSQRVAAEHYERFVKTCKELKIPLKVAKSIVGAVKAPLLGAEVDGREGIVRLAPEKAAQFWGKSLGLMTTTTWHHQALLHWAGHACFADQFRRPLFSILQDIFQLIQ